MPRRHKCASFAFKGEVRVYRRPSQVSDFPTPLFTCDRNMVTFFLSTVTFLFLLEAAPSENVLKGVESCLLASKLSDLRPGTQKMYGRKTSGTSHTLGTVRNYRQLTKYG